MQIIFYLCKMYGDDRRVDVGRRGENIALEYLLEKGMILRDRNWRIRHLELDLIMETETELHIVEVRSRKSPVLVNPAETVLGKKQRNIVRAAAVYVGMKNISKEVVFDIVSIIFLEDGYSLEYIENAFLPYIY